MQKPAVALFGAEIVVGILLPEGSSEIKRNIYSIRFRSAVQCGVTVQTGVDLGFSLGRCCKQRSKKPITFHKL